jgi:eukaryotic-like serine/threonine-protein kinase
MPISPGARLGPYEILSPLGAGGMGEVWRARDNRLGREVAIKVLPADAARDPDRVRRFEVEARSASALNHPAILTVHDFGVDAGVAYLVTELLSGRTLREVLVDGPVSTRRALDWAVQIARGLAAAHEKGILHRDLKPENLFVTDDGRVKILDFGIAKLTLPLSTGPEANTAVATGTEAGTLLGTVGYMAPEQLRAQPVDERADLFSLGCVLYERKDRVPPRIERRHVRGHAHRNADSTRGSRPARRGSPEPVSRPGPRRPSCLGSPVR